MQGFSRVYESVRIYIKCIKAPDYRREILPEKAALKRFFRPICASTAFNAGWSKRFDTFLVKTRLLTKKRASDKIWGIGMMPRLRALARVK